MSQDQKARALIYEKVGDVLCSPPALEYKSDKCLGKASLVCHHCHSPLCKECASLLVDRDFPVFSEIEGKSNMSFYGSLTSRFAIAFLLFPVSFMINSFFARPLHISELSITFQTISVRLPTASMSLVVNFMIIIAVVLLLSGITKMSTIYLRREETPTGERVLKIFEKRNLTAVHCKYCKEKYHKTDDKIQRISLTGMASLLVVAVAVVIQGYLVGFVDLTFPIVSSLIVNSLYKILRRTREIPITGAF